LDCGTPDHEGFTLGWARETADTRVKSFLTAVGA